MNRSGTQPQTQSPAITIHADLFQPFKSRLGIDQVVRLHFTYAPHLVARLKAILALYAIGSSHKVVGGWLPKFKCWFVEPSVWDAVCMELQFLGHRVLERKP